MEAEQWGTKRGKRADKTVATEVHRISIYGGGHPIHKLLPTDNYGWHDGGIHPKNFIGSGHP